MVISSKSTAVKLFLVAVLCCSGFLSANSQVSVTEQPEVKQLMERFVKYGKEEAYVEGWRIKIISTTNRRDLESARWLFNQKYPDINYVISHESPHYSLITGAFETRIDVEPMLNEFKAHFPTALPYRDRIMKNELFIANGL